jgi:hypothetical protein
MAVEVLCATVTVEGSMLPESVKSEIDMVCWPFLHILPRRESIWLPAKTVTTPIP